MAVFCFIFKDWNLLIVAILNILYNINNLIFETDDSTTIDKYNGSKTLQSKALMISIGATYADNLNDNCTCLSFDNNRLTNCHGSRHGKLPFPIDRNKMGINAIAAMCEYGLTETMTNREIFTNLLTLTGQTGNGVKIRDTAVIYKFEECKNSVRNYLCNTTLVNVYSNGKTKCDFESTTNEVGCKVRIQYVKNTNAVFSCIIGINTIVF